MEDSLNELQDTLEDLNVEINIGFDRAALIIDTLMGGNGTRGLETSISLIGKRTMSPVKAINDKGNDKNRGRKYHQWSRK